MCCASASPKLPAANTPRRHRRLITCTARITSGRGRAQVRSPPPSSRSRLAHRFRPPIPRVRAPGACGHTGALAPAARSPENKGSPWGPPSLTWSHLLPGRRVRAPCRHLTPATKLIFAQRSSWKSVKEIASPSMAFPPSLGTKYENSGTLNGLLGLWFYEASCSVFSVSFPEFTGIPAASFFSPLAH